jgi:hypothetical protein
VPLSCGAVVVIVTLYTNGVERNRQPPSIDAMSDDDDMPGQEVIDFVAERAPELDPAAVSHFMAEHPLPADVRESHVAWAVRVLRETGEGEVGEGLPVDRVVREIRRLDR